MGHQYNAQKSILKAEYDRNVTMATQQFEQQRLQQEMALDQQYKQQTMQLDMVITSQAAQMTADAQQHKLQIDMQTKMASLYSTGLNAAAGGAGAKPAAKP